MAPTRATRKPAPKVSCDDCYFKVNELCALKCQGTPCTSFRPWHPDGLRPPQQLRFVFRQEMQKRVAWAFRSAEETAELYRT